VEARPCPIIEFFNGSKQLLVPLFQRPYEWGPKEWEVLWSDLLEQYEQRGEDLLASHFTGAIVTAPAKSVPVGVSKYLVIDGQQRLTTIAIIICALRSLIETNTSKHRKLTSFLVNEYDEGLDYYKLLPTQLDRDAFKELVSQNYSTKSRFLDAFEFYRKRLSGEDSDGTPIDAEKLFEVIQSRLTVVAIHLGDTDDPYLIFESLNAKGAPLTQADLIRNYLLLRLPSGNQQQVYEEAWLPMQSLLTGEHLTEFMRQYLMLSGEEVAKSAIYSVLKNRLANSDEHLVANELRAMQGMSLLYAQIVGLTWASDSKISAALSRLRRWEVATANTFILRVLKTNEDDGIAAEEVVNILGCIESFVVRRAVCSVPTNQLKRVFLSLAKEMPETEVLDWLLTTLSGGASGRRWPKDEEFADSLGQYRAYANPIDRCKFVLETLELGYGHKEPASFDAASIEHIMPQTLSAEWKADLGDEWDAVYEKWLDRLSNLTLTGYNSELSNSPFAKKRQLMASSNFELNKWIAAQERWTEQELQNRSVVLFKRAKMAWPRPETLIN
jgi:uncharacterized protein with ParB-like and HNH nuclease domain